MCTLGPSRQSCCANESSSYQTAEESPQTEKQMAGKRKGDSHGASSCAHRGTGFREKTMRDAKQPKQMEAEILETLRRPIEKEMLAGLHTYVESLTDDEAGYVKKFLERRRVAMNEQSFSVAPRMQ